MQKYVNCWIPVAEILTLIMLEVSYCSLPFILTHTITNPKHLSCSYLIGHSHIRKYMDDMTWLHFNTFYDSIFLIFSSQSCVWKCLKAIFSICTCSVSCWQTAILLSLKHTSPQKKEFTSQGFQSFPEDFNQSVTDTLASCPRLGAVLTVSGNSWRGSPWKTALGLSITVSFGMWGQYGAVGESQWHV